MVSLFALYLRPTDEQDFLAHYRDVHAPLAQALPGLISLDWGPCRSMGSGDDNPWFLVAEMRFQDSAAAQHALASPQGRAAGDDVNQFAGGLLTMRMVEWL